MPSTVSPLKPAVKIAAIGAAASAASVEALRARETSDEWPIEGRRLVFNGCLQWLGICLKVCRLARRHPRAQSIDAKCRPVTDPLRHAARLGVSPGALQAARHNNR